MIDVVVWGYLDIVFLRWLLVVSMFQFSRPHSEGSAATNEY